MLKRVQHDDEGLGISRASLDAPYCIMAVML